LDPKRKVGKNKEIMFQIYLGSLEGEFCDALDQMELLGPPKTYGWMGYKKYSLLLYNSSYKYRMETHLFKQPLVKGHPKKIHLSN
jgi:hypothetical protein